MGLRWLFGAVVGTALAVTAILNSSDYWLAGSRFALVMLVGLSAARSLAYGREAPWSFGFSVCALTTSVVRPEFDLGSLAPDLGLGFYQESLLIDHFTAIAFGCLGGLVCEAVVRRSRGVPPIRPGFFVTLAFVVAFALAVGGSAWLKVHRQTQADENHPDVMGFGTPPSQLPSPFP